MKKWMIGMLAAVTAVSLAACTPTTEKERQAASSASTAAAAPEEAAQATTGGADDKVPDPNVKPVAVVSIYHSTDGETLDQEMDSLESEELDAQELVDKMTEYGVFTEGTKVLSFTIDGEGETSVGTLDLNQAESPNGYYDNIFLEEIGDTFIENFELGKLKLLVNGENYRGEDIQQGDDDFLTYQ